MQQGKILFLDLDGTLLTDDKKISEGNRNAIKNALDHGNYVIAVTGRHVESGRSVVKELGLTMSGCYMLAFNGSVFYDCSADRILKEQTIPVQHVYRLFEKAKDAGIYIQTYNRTEILTEKHTRELDLYTKRTKMKYKVFPDMSQALDEEPHKVLLISLEGRQVLENFQYENAEWTEEILSSFLSCNEYLEYCPKGVDKGFAIEYLCRFLNIPMENTIAVGDELNDLTMIEKAHVGVAVANAVEQVKSVADYVTQNDNNHDAVAEVIEKFVFCQYNE